MEKDSRRRVWISAEAMVFILFVASLIYQGRTIEGLAAGLLLLICMIMWHGRRPLPSNE